MDITESNTSKVQQNGKRIRVQVDYEVTHLSEKQRQLFHFKSLTNMGILEHEIFQMSEDQLDEAIKGIRETYPTLVKNSEFYVNALRNRAGKLYEAYCAAVGGFAFNGDPLPDWNTFYTDPNKQKQVEAWLAVAAL